VSEILWEEPNKAESAKLPSAGIAPKPCPRNSAAEEEKCTVSVHSVEAMPSDATARRKARKPSFPQRVMVECGLEWRRNLEKLARPLECPLYQLFYDGEEPPKLPNLPKAKSSDDIAKTLATSTSFGGC